MKILLALFLASTAYASPSSWPVLGVANDARNLLPHAGSSGANPVPTVNANAGTAGSCAVDAAANDQRGVITLVTGSGSYSSGAQCAMAFVVDFNNSAYCMVSPNAAIDETLLVTVKPYVSTGSTALTINFGSADSSAHTYVWTYHCED